jgi:penicillin-binding protein 1B
MDAVLRRSRHLLELARAASRRHWKLLVVVGLLGVAWLIHLDRMVAARFESELMPVASQVYSRPVELLRGAHLSQIGLFDHLRRIGYREADASSLAPGEFSRDGRRITVARRPFAYSAPLAAGGPLVIDVDRKGRIRGLRGSEGSLERAWLEPERIGSFYGDYWLDRRPLSLDAYPTHLIDALLAMEDRRFFDHHGIDVRRIVGALFANLSEGRVAQGGSTLTQQLVKNLYLTSERSLARKIREAPMSLLLELHHSKEEILEAYLNEIYLGQRGPVAIHGVGAAARHYFGKDASELALEESAMLVGMIHGPGIYSPETKPDAARTRRDLVLSVMREQELIPEDVYRAARSRPVSVVESGAYPNPAPYFLSSLRRSLEQRYGTEELEEGGYVIGTALDARLQRLARRVLREGLEELERHHPRLKSEGSPLQAALVAIDPRSSEIRAMVGGRDFAKSQFNRAEQASRQPGSAFKPIVALAALGHREGEAPRFTLASLLEDAPLTVRTPTGDWSPANYGNKSLGRVTFREAMARSLNRPFVRVGLQVGPEGVVEVARRLGIRSDLAPVPSLALGASEMTLLELTGAYAVLAAQGRRRPPVGIAVVFDSEGVVVEKRDRQTQQAFSPSETYLVTSALRSVVESGTGQGLRRLGYRGPVAGKTGTTNDERDAWFVGYTPELAIGVWVGFDDNRSHGLTGAQAALPIFGRFLTSALGPEGGEDFERPAELEVVKINPERGVRAGWGCRGKREVFLPATAPQQWCGERGVGGFLRALF